MLQAVYASDLGDIIDIVLSLEESVDVFEAAVVVALVFNSWLVQDLVARRILLREQLQLCGIILILLTCDQVR